LYLFVLFFVIVFIIFFCFFFFFQAEDGIRDRNVTGVQTCALPICCRRADAPSSESAPAWYPAPLRSVLCRPHPSSRRFDSSHHRSEERRVGKECRSRWGPYE